ncbi:MAG: cache domain-containing protein [Sedimentisphaerales bacterium]|nr:cache domain-containing protein [Sedimentisphaerales bacterium]
MKAQKLRTRILISFDIVIVAFSVAVALLGYYVIKKDVLERAQTKVKNDLNSAREIYDQEVGRVRDVVRLTAQRFFIKEAISDNDRQTLNRELGRIREQEFLDVLTLTDSSGNVIIRSRNPSQTGDSQGDDGLVGFVMESGQSVVGTAIVAGEELAKEGADLAEQAHIKFIPTPKAKATDQTEQSAGMMIKAAGPVFGYDGKLAGVLYGGNLLNRNYSIVDKVKETVYKGEIYKGKDVGTVTIFQGDLRISTNVANSDGARAVGTRVSQEVNEQVLEKGLPWIGRAFVVNAWYKTAYEPIKDVDGDIVGILYVGILERPFNDMSRNIFFVFLVIVIAVSGLSAAIGTVLTRKISRPVERMLQATQKLSGGDLGYEVESRTGTLEFDALAASFNKMAAELRRREESLKTINEELKGLNKTYLDVVGFVSHELKGIVATTIMNAAAVQEGLFGEINAKQEQALQAVTKNLEYLRETVRKFLDLSRIEKGELAVIRKTTRLREDVFDPCVETFKAEIANRKMEVTNNIAADVTVSGDIDLLHIAANNLVGNAVKYGLDRGRVVIGCEDLGDKVQIEVYNDSRPITLEEKGRLFKKFSRLERDSGTKVKGTGLGLFVTKEIIAKHGGDIWVEPRENGNSFLFTIGKESNSAPKD